MRRSALQHRRLAVLEPAALLPSFALVGSVGAVSTGTSGAAVTPAWGTSETRAIGNLLVCWVDEFGHSGAPTLTAGWNMAGQIVFSASFCNASIWTKIAAGGDAAPTVSANVGSVWSVQVAEFTLVTPGAVDRTGTNTTAGAASLVTNAAAPDLAVGELVLYASVMPYASAATRTITSSLNNGATDNNTNNGGTSTLNHYSFGWGITTGNASADQETCNASGNPPIGTVVLSVN